MGCIGQCSPISQGLIPQVSEPEFVCSLLGQVSWGAAQGHLSEVVGSPMTALSILRTSSDSVCSCLLVKLKGRSGYTDRGLQQDFSTMHFATSQGRKAVFVFEPYWSWIPAPSSTLPHCCDCLWNMRSTHDSLLPWFTWINNKAPNWEVIISSHQGMWSVWKRAQTIYPQHPETPKVIHFSRRQKQDWTWKFPEHFMKGN